MNPQRHAEIMGRYGGLSIALLGDFCLDRYLEIDPSRDETSLETGLRVHNVVAVRAQAGAAGTVLNNLAALGVGTILPIGFVGDDGEGFELCRALRALPGVHCEALVQTPLRRTFTYCKPLIVEPGRPPRELSRLDSKNWSPTPPEVEDLLIAAIERYGPCVDALTIMDQVTQADTGALTRRVVAAVGELAARFPRLRILADSRRSLRGYPPVSLKMNRDELGRLLDRPPPADAAEAGRAALELAQRNGREVFVTLAEAGLVGAAPDGEVVALAARPIRGPIDIVGAGDAVTANLTAALTAGAGLREALELANAAASVVIHQLGDTGTASPAQIIETLSTTPRVPDA